MKLHRIAALLILCFPASVYAECMIGELPTVAGNFVPRFFAEANGQLLPISQHQALFSILGTMYGGDGRTTFALPNIQNGLTHQPASGNSVVLKTLICIDGTYPSRS